MSAGDTKGVTVGFIGLGIMGGAMAANLRKNGFRLVINDIRREAGATHERDGAIWAESARTVAEKSEVVITCLPTLGIVEQVVLGAGGVLDGMRAGQALFECSTVSRELVHKLDAAFNARGAIYMESPISGGGTGARRGRLAVWVGGDKDTFERYEPMLRAFGDFPTLVGPVGAGLVTKLVHNCSSQTTQAALAEIFSFGVKAGADPLALWKAIRQGSIGRRRTFDGLGNQFLKGDFDTNPEAALRIVYKDMMLATGLARELDAPMRFASLAFAEIQEAMNRGWSERDARCVMALPQERLGLAIKVDPADLDEVVRLDPAAPTDTRRG